MSQKSCSSSSSKSDTKKTPETNGCSTSGLSVHPHRHRPKRRSLADLACTCSSQTRRRVKRTLMRNCSTKSTRCVPIASPQNMRCVRAIFFVELLMMYFRFFIRRTAPRLMPFHPFTPLNSSSGRAFSDRAFDQLQAKPGRRKSRVCTQSHLAAQTDAHFVSASTKAIVTVAGRVSTQAGAAGRRLF